MTDQTSASAIGLATIAYDGVVLDTWFPQPLMSAQREDHGTILLSPHQTLSLFGESAAAFPTDDAKRQVRVVAVRTGIGSIAEPPTDVHDVYLRLHLLSHRLVRPHEANLSNIFSILPNVAWTSLGPCLPSEIDNVRWRVRAEGSELRVRSIDKSPRMTDYVVH